jgi:hypothetical protein
MSTALPSFEPAFVPKSRPNARSLYSCHSVKTKTPSKPARKFLGRGNRVWEYACRRHFISYTFGPERSLVALTRSKLRDLVELGFAATTAERVVERWQTVVTRFNNTEAG